MANKRPEFQEIKPATSYAGEETAGSTAYVPDLGSATKGVPPTKVAACPPFVMIYHPARWTVMGENLIPQLGKLKLQPGIQGADSKGSGKVAIGDPRNFYEEMGWTLIPPTAIPPEHVRPGEPASYLRNPAGRPDVTIHYCEEVYPGESYITCNEKKYVQWAQYLIAQNIVKPAPVYVLRAMLEQAQKSANEMADKARHNSNFAATAERLARVAKVIEAELATRQGPMVPSESSATTVDMGDF